MQKYPIGIQDFRSLREGGYMYVDKTEILHHLITSGKYYFLSRPRRFGKSLVVSTLKEIFSGSKELFAGLWIQDKIKWERRPVIQLSFGGMDTGADQFIPNFIATLRNIATGFDLHLQHENLPLLVEELLQKLSRLQGKVVLLVDEYDKPMLDHIENQPLADTNRLILKGFYDTLKNCDQYLHFLFLTGISKFAKVSIFSGLNNLNDITLDAKYATLCGYTDAELRHYFDEEVHEIANTHQKSAEALYEDIRLWYNGYSWRGEKVYNPFSILNFVSKGEFSNFWFATGHPSFLVKRLTAVFAYRIENVEIDPMIFDGASIDNVDYRSLLFQTGYLTITGENKERQTLTLNYPNKEVKDALLKYTLGGFAHRSHLDSQISALDLKDALAEGDLERFQHAVNALFASIPHQIFLQHYEAYYQSILYIVFTLLGIFVKCEVSTSKGRIDAVIVYPHRIYIIEFKINDTARAALDQIREKGYANAYIAAGKPVTLLGIGLGKEERGVTDMETATPA